MVATPSSTGRATRYRFTVPAEIHVEATQQTGGQGREGGRGGKETGEEGAGPGQQRHCADLCAERHPEVPGTDQPVAALVEDRRRGVPDPDGGHDAGRHQEHVLRGERHGQGHGEHESGADHQGDGQV